MSDDKHTPTPEEAPAGVTRRQFLALTATSSLALPLLLESCTPQPSRSDAGSQREPAEGGGAAEISPREATYERPQEPPPDPGLEPVPEPDRDDSAPDGERTVDDGEPDRDAGEPSPDQAPPIDDADAGQEPVPERGPDNGGEVSFDPSKTPESRKLFPLGVQAGAMRATSAVVWTFLEGITSATLKVWREGSVAGKVVMAVDKTVPRGKDGYTHVPLQGLSGGQWYSYAFFSGTARSVVGRFRTAFAPGVRAPLTIGATTCTYNRFAPFEALKKLAKERIDCLLHMGDMSYNDGSKTVSDYRNVWKKQIQAGGYKELLPHTGMYITWDDHEITNNFDPEKMDKKQLAAGKDAFFETLPVERGPNDRLWNSYLWGNTAEILVLDSRSERKPSTRTGSDPTYLGKAQMKWVKDRLKKSPAHFKILMNSVPMTNMPPIWLSSSDRWEGYKSQREELLNHITDNNIKGVWFLSGDFHVGFVSKLEPKGKWSKLREVAVGPGDSFPNPLGVVGLPKSQFDFGSAFTRVMTTLTFDPVSNEVRIRFVRDNGVILYDSILQSA